MVVAGVLLVVYEVAIRGWEAHLFTGFMSGIGIQRASSLGSVVVFPAHGQLVGLSLTEGCTAALLVSPFCLIAAGLVATRRIGVSRGLLTLAVIAVALFVVNQLRLVAIAFSVRIWGIATGYERSHVFFGTVVSTVGLIGALMLLLLAVSHERKLGPKNG